MMRILCVIVCLIGLSICQRRPAAPRDYTEEYPESRRPPLTTEQPSEESEEGEQSAVNVAQAPSINDPPICFTKECSPDERYLQHYYARNCTPVEGAIRYCSRKCWQNFVCPNRTIGHIGKVAASIVSPGCHIGNKVIRFGNDIPFSNDCKKCKCLNRNGEATITCAVVDCPEALNPFPQDGQNCYYAYELGKCCSTRRECPTARQLSTMRNCTYEGKQYKRGERIYPKSNPCMECVCDGNWTSNNPLKSRACRKINCDLDLEEKMQKGCVPIYHEDHCCPIDYYCPPPKDHKCVFDGQSYAIGSKLQMNDKCVSCECVVPPDFTCMKKTCPLKPFENCITNHDNDQCCPIYKCPRGSLHNLTNIFDHSKPFNTGHQNHHKQPRTDIQFIDENDSIFKIQPYPYNETGINYQTGTVTTVTAAGKACATNVKNVRDCKGINCKLVTDRNGCKTCSCYKCPELNCDFGSGCSLVSTIPGACAQCSCPSDDDEPVASKFLKVSSQN